MISLTSRTKYKGGRKIPLPLTHLLYGFRSPTLRKGKVTKQYLAICHGDPGFDSVVDAPLYRRSSGKVGAVNPWEAEEFKAKDARTRVRNVATAAGECPSGVCGEAVAAQSVSSTRCERDPWWSSAVKGRSVSMLM